MMQNWSQIFDHKVWEFGGACDQISYFYNFLGAFNGCTGPVKNSGPKALQSLSNVPQKQPSPLDVITSFNFLQSEVLSVINKNPECVFIRFIQKYQNVGRDVCQLNIRHDLNSDLFRLKSLSFIGLLTYIRT